MTETDFEELDRAVTGLMNDVGQPVPANNPAPIASSPVPVQPVPPVQSARPAAPSMAASGRRRFMDIKRPVTARPVSSSFSRGVNDNNTQPEPTVQPVEDKGPSSSGLSAERVVAPVSPDLQAVSTLDNANSTAVASSVLNTTDNNGRPEPLESPFLPDAKPDKRPLGSHQTLVVEPPTVDESVVGNVEDLENEHSDTEIRTRLPEELNNADLVGLESDTTVAGAAVSQEPADTMAGAAGSIPQQYTEQASTAPAESAPIYASENYAGAIANTPKKSKSTAKQVILLVVLLIVGAGAGAVYFWFTR